jgi:hypothetical protein
MRLIILTILFIGLSFAAHAQKLPKVQSIGLRVPADIKIDGNIGEWGNKFEAYNKATQIFYSIANDNDHLYLVVHITDNTIINKAVAGGITLTVSNSDKKDDNTGIAITFPKYNPLERPPFNMSFSYKPPVTRDSLKDKAQIDSVRRAYNRKLSAQAKFIGTAGINNIDDNISIYNYDRIKVAFGFDNKLAYNYELSFPSAYLPLKVVNKTKLHYQIKLNGLAVDGTNIREPREGYFVFTGADGRNYLGMGPDFAGIMSPTNFSGDYLFIQ